MISEVIKNLSNMLSDEDVVRKSDITLGVSNILKVCESELKPSLDQLSVYLKTASRDINVSKLGIRVRDNKELASLLEDDFNILYDGLVELKALVEDELPKMMTLSAMTVKQSAVIELSNHLNSLVSFTGSIYVFVVYRLNNEVVIYKKKEEEIIRRSSAYNRMMKIYRGKGLTKKITEIKGLSNAEIVDDPVVMRELVTNNDLKFNLPTNGFNGSPLFAIGKWWTEFQLRRADVAKDEKRIVELKLMELRSRDTSGNVDTNISSQIEYYENKLKMLEKKINDLEEV